MTNLTKDGFRQSAPDRRGESAEGMKRAELVEELAKTIYGHMPGPDGTEIFMEEPWRSCLDAAEAILAHLDALGLCVVPKEPTEQMTRDCSGVSTWSAVEHDDFGNIYRAMIAAARG